MAALRISVLFAFAALLGFLLGTQVGEPDRADPEGSTLPLADDSADLEARIAELESSLSISQLEGERLRTMLQREREKKESGDPSDDPADASAIPGTKSLVIGSTGGGGRLIRSLAEAEAAFDRAIAAGDLESLWLLGADLLSFGPEGFAMFDVLFDSFMVAMEENRGFRPIFRDEELWMGRFFRALAEEHEGFLAYGLHLAQKDPEQMSEGMARFRNEVFDDELLPVLLGFHGAQNPELTGAWLDQLETFMGMPDLGGADEESVLYGLANIPDDRAADLIGDWIATRDDHRDDAIRALTLQGSARARQILVSLLPQLEDEGLRAVIEQYLGL